MFSAVTAAHASSIEWAADEARVLAHGNAPPGSATAASAAGPAPAPVTPASALAAAVAPSHVAGLRISGLDALALDSELGWMLGAQLRRACKYLQGGGWLTNHKAECELVLHATMFLCTLARDRPTPGMKLQNLQFQNYAAVRACRGGTAASSSWLSDAWSEWVARWLGGAAGIMGQGGAASIDTLKKMLPANGGARADGRTTVPLSHFAPFAATTADTAASLLSDAAAASGAAPPPSAVLLSSVPSTAPLCLSRAQKVAYFTGSVVLRYLWAKLTHRMTMEGWGGFPEHDWHRKVYNACRQIEHVYQMLNIVNFIAFLHNGTYRTLLERVLSLRLLYVRSRVARQVSFEFMNQQIAWQSLSDFMLFLLPMINFGAIINGVKWGGRALGLLPPVHTARAAGAGGAGGASISTADALAAGCPCCGLQPACQPHVAQPCGHIFCYYCLAGNRMAEQQQARGAGHGLVRADFACPACQQAITSQTPLQAVASPPSQAAHSQLQA